MTTNQYQEKPRKPVYNGLLPTGDYDAVVVKVTPCEARGQMPASLRLMFLIDLPENVAFVSGYINQTFKSNDKTATWLKNLGVVATSNVTPIDQLKGKRCKITVLPGNKVFNQKLGVEVQYHKIHALYPANTVIPQVVGQPQQIQQPVQQVYQQPVVQTQPVAQPVVQSMSQAVQNNPFVGQGQAVVNQPVNQPAVQPVYAVPQTNYVQPKPQVQPQPVVLPQGNNMAAQLAQVAQTAIQASATQPVPQQIQQQVAQSLQAQPVQPAPVAQPVAQPLPSTTVSLDF